MRLDTRLMVLGTVFLTGCSPFFHIKQACKKDPSLCDPVVKIDTITKIKTVEKITEIVNYKTDTTYVFKNKDSVIVRFAIRDSLIYLDAECPPSETVTIEKPKIIYKTVKKPISFFQKVTYLFAGICLLGIIVFLLTKLI